MTHAPPPQADTDLEAILSRISHDLRTPLVRLRMEVEVSALPQSARLGIDDDIAQIDHCFKQLMEYARPAREAPRLAIDVTAALSALCEHERARVESLGGSLDVKLEPGLNAYVSALEISLMVSNLIDNARRYGRSADGGLTIELSLVADQDVLIIDVSDCGSGIPPKDMARLMRPFWRGKPIHHSGDNIGVGLGLPIIERLLAPAGGSLRLFNRDVGGLTARIALPRHKSIA